MSHLGIRVGYRNGMKCVFCTYNFGSTRGLVTVINHAYGEGHVEDRPQEFTEELWHKVVDRAKDLEYNNNKERR